MTVPWHPVQGRKDARYSEGEAKKTRRRCEEEAKEGWRGKYLKGHDVIGRSRRVGVRGLNPRVLRESVSRVNIYIPKRK